MPTFNFKSASIAAGGSIDNLLAGSQWEILTQPCAIAIGLVQDGGVIGDILATITSGTDTLAEEQPISNANRMPILPDDIMVTDVAAALDRLKIKVRNPSAGARVVFGTLRIDPL